MHTNCLVGLDTGEIVVGAPVIATRIEGAKCATSGCLSLAEGRQTCCNHEGQPPLAVQWRGAITALGKLCFCYSCVLTSHVAVWWPTGPEPQAWLQLGTGRLRGQTMAWGRRVVLKEF